MLHHSQQLQQALFQTPWTRVDPKSTNRHARAILLSQLKNAQTGYNITQNVYFKRFIIPRATQLLPALHQLAEGDLDGWLHHQGHLHPQQHLCCEGVNEDDCLPAGELPPQPCNRFDLAVTL